MIRVYQTKFGGIDSPIEKQGNCFQACVASILEIPLEQAFDCIPYEEETGKSYDESVLFNAFNEWLAQYGLACIFIQLNRVQPQMSNIKGYHMAEVESSTLKNGEMHMVIINGWEIVHDPNPNSKTDLSKLYGIYLFVPLDVATYTKIKEKL